MVASPSPDVVTHAVKSQRGARHEPRRRPAARTALLVALLALALASVAVAGEMPTPDRTGPELVGLDTPLGRFDYQLGRGLRLGDTRLTLGGFTTAEFERLQSGHGTGGLEGVNLFLFFDPVSFVHVFSELEVSGLALWETGQKGVRSDADFGVERLYADVGASDTLNLRVGKFFTPIGQWNQAPAEPLVWTSSEPLIVEDVFDETTSGAMLFGSTFPRGGTLSYAVYGSFFDTLGRADPRPADHNAGFYLDWASLGGWSAGASYFAAELPTGHWNHLGGVDARWHPTGRVELSGEALVGEGSRQEGFLWGFYTQGVVETVRTLYAIGRYEHFDTPGAGRAIDLFDVGLTWVPRYYLRLKVDYQFADHADELSAPGLRASFSILF
jgi:hypothetical protein